MAVVCAFLCMFCRWVFFVFCCVMIRRPPRSTRTDTLFLYTTLFRAGNGAARRRCACLAQIPGQGLSGSHERNPSARDVGGCEGAPTSRRSEEHTSELQSLMRISYAVFCLKKNKPTKHTSSYNSYNSITRQTKKHTTNVHH